MAAVDDVRVLAARGLFEDAIGLAAQIEEPSDRVDALIEVALRAAGSRDDLMQRIMGLIDKSLKKIKEPYERAYVLSRLGHLHSRIGNVEEASELFDEAADSIAKIKDVREKTLALALMAYHLTTAGFIEDGLAAFEEAFNLAVSANMDYRRKLDLIIEVANFIEAAGDALSAGDALRFYEMAYDIFDKLYVSQKAAEVEKKMDVARTVSDFGSPEVRKALLEGRYMYALKSLQKRLKDPQDRFIAMLELAHWLKKVGAPEYFDVMDEAFKLLEGIGLSQANVQKAAAILTEMGSPERALSFALEIKDPEKRDEALAAVALKLAEGRDFIYAREVAGKVGDSMLRARLLQEIGRIEERERWEA
ncbi:tetratricopeptide repeat protein [Thermococcus sp.]|uniref:tetratricopeptide repeat protein n=1 Tax=Thermococcus sp. TaxID=35749 RepID=UPI0026258147|nr:tetratricopeptide repeat protein [Thermococcus sp.]